MTAAFTSEFAASFSRAFKIDEETGLPNRRGLIDIMRQYNQDEEPNSIVVLVDFVNWPAIKHRFGDAAIEEIIQQFAGHVEQQTNAHYVIARMVGEAVFAVYIKDKPAQFSQNAFLKALGAFKVKLKGHGYPLQAICVANNRDLGEKASVTISKALQKLNRIKQVKQKFAGAFALSQRHGQPANDAATAHFDDSAAHYAADDNAALVSPLGVAGVN